MVSSPRHTIVGVATGSPDGGVAILRLSGPNVRSVAEQLGISDLRPRVAVLRKINSAGASQFGSDVAGEDALVLWMPGPASYTGEDTLELHIHGGAVNVRQILSWCLDAGAQPAPPGEFTRRAFANGKLSLDQAEAVASIIGAQSQQELEQARRLLRGDLATRVDVLRQQLFTLRVEIEAHLDFPEDLESEQVRIWQDRANEVHKQLLQWERLHEQSRRRKGDFCVALAGPPNAGKSALFNALLGRHRALVSPVAGTTRDYVEAEFWIGGVAIRLIDTAGFRDSEDAIEQAGIEIGRREIAEADLVLWLEASDDVEVASEHLREFVGEQPCLCVESKRDRSTRRPEWLGVSTESGFEQSVEQLREQLAVQLQKWQEEQPVPWLGLARHAECVKRARAELHDAISLMESHGEASPAEIVAFMLGASERQLGEIVGRHALGAVGDDVLDAIFSTFCIGK